MAGDIVHDLFTRARAFHERGDRERALACLREILCHEPHNSGAFNNIGLLFYEANAVDESIDAYKEALRIDPGHAEVYCNCAAALSSKGAVTEAEMCYKKALSLKPRLFEAIVGLAALRYDAADLEGAKQLYCEALRLRPDHGGAHFRLGKIMREWDRLGHAADCFRNAIRFQPRYLPALINLGETLQAAGEIDESEKIFCKVIALDPGENIAYSNFFISMNYNPVHSPPRIFEAHRRWGERLASFVPKAAPFTNSADPERKLLIGYVSADFCRHPAASFLDPVLRHRDRGRFGVVCYSQGAIHDEKTKLLKSFADAWRKIRTWSDDEAEREIRRDAVDILIDCTGHMADNRLPLFARKCAPVQVSWIGYPNTTGLAAVDYRLTDAIADPPSDDTLLYTEKLIRLETGFCCYTPPENAPPPAPPPVLTNGYITFGSLHTLARLNGDVIGAWSGVLERLPSSRLIVFRNTLNETIERRLSAAFGENGIDRRRIEFIGRVPDGGHLAVYDRIDISLDTFPWSGHTTACESLWMGVPVITLYGDRHAGRMVASVLSRLELTDCIAGNREEFAGTALRLATDPPRLAALRRDLRGKMRESPLCDGPAFTGTVEREYRTMWRHWCERRA